VAPILLPGIDRSESPEVSVVVACRNEIKYIRNFLDSLSRQVLCGTRVEVLIADGMSDDGTREILELYQRTLPALRVIENPNRIASSGLNAAIREARGEIIIRMDAHSEYAPDYVRCCLDVLNETNADNVGGPALTRAEGYLAQAIALAYHTRFACGGAKFHDAHHEGFVDTVPYGCWRKSTLARIGLFDESLCRSQDDELNRRIISSGGTIWQSPKITSSYRPRTTLPALFHQYFQYGFWKVAVIRKHGKPASWRHLVPGACVFIGVVLLLGAAGASLAGSPSGRSLFMTACAVFAGLYFTVSLGAALHVAQRNGWRFFPALPFVFGTYHVSYGLGFLLGLSYHPRTWDRPSHLRNVLTVITR
jgi:succinoglycan biosynthesis protein ExoA